MYNDSRSLTQLVFSLYGRPVFSHMFPLQRSKRKNCKTKYKAHNYNHNLFFFISFKSLYFCFVSSTLLEAFCYKTIINGRFFLFTFITVLANAYNYNTTFWMKVQITNWLLNGTLKDMNTSKKKLRTRLRANSLKINHCVVL